MKRLVPLMASCLLILSACGDDNANRKASSKNNNNALTKPEAQQKMEDDPNAPDYCEQYSWYGDGTCDTFCRKEDTADCATSPQSCDDANPCMAGSTCQRPEGQCSASGMCVDTTTLDCNTAIEPVCGCDGKTYDNACQALTSGQSVASKGACQSDATCEEADCGPKPQLPNFLCSDGVTMAGPTGRCLKNEDNMCGWEVLECPADNANTCGGKMGTTCQDKEYCDLGFGQCDVTDAQGKCRATPEQCPEQSAPVCGCDGKTYDNACLAAKAQTSVDYNGACVAQTVECDSNNGDKDCKDGEFCQLPEKYACGKVDTKGICKPKPDLCTKELNYVCGCDGVTYANACMAASAGANIASAGQCKNDGTVCGGLNTTKCGAGEYCAKPTGQCDPRQEGTCKEQPLVCNKVLSYVCGCDGKTYDNACLASQAGVNVAATGKCVSSSGCKTDLECGRGEFCKFPTDTCDIRAKTGKCTSKPLICNRLYAPVCGCDNKTYSNACEADLAGESLRSTKACGIKR